MNKTKITIKSIWGKLLFEHKSSNNSIKKTLRKANLRRVDLYGANLRWANLYEANLRRVNLHEADLYEANLRGADLRGANLRRANLYEADLHEANLRWADLRGANLRRANLYEADLYEADLRGAKNVNYNELWFAQTRILPEGDIIGYKKCKDSIIVKLLIPKNAKRSHAFGRKCRAEFAKVIEIYGADEAKSSHDSSFVYRVGETVKSEKPFSENWLEECESGIHFFITKKEAEYY